MNQVCFMIMKLIVLIISRTPENNAAAGCIFSMIQPSSQ